jgi:hypothetical protein
LIESVYGKPPISNLKKFYPTVWDELLGHEGRDKEKNVASA